MVPSLPPINHIMQFYSKVDLNENYKENVNGNLYGM
jgi:hypothetical protein